MPKNYDMGERAKTSIESTVLDVWKAAADNGDSGENSYEVGTDRYRKHTEDKTPGQSAETALESNGQAQLKGLKETVLGMWKEAANSAVDPKEREELDTAPEKTAKKMKRADEPKPMVATEETEEMYDELAEKLTAKQKKIDVDGDGEIEGSDLAKLRKKAKKEGKDELELAKELKVNSMKEALAKVWGFQEHKGNAPHKHPHEEKKEDKKGKTETGKKPAVVELEPETQGK